MSDAKWTWLCAYLTQIQATKGFKNRWDASKRLSLTSEMTLSLMRKMECPFLISNENNCAAGSALRHLPAKGSGNWNWSDSAMYSISELHLLIQNDGDSKCSRLPNALSFTTEVHEDEGASADYRSSLNRKGSPHDQRSVNLEMRLVGLCIPTTYPGKQKVFADAMLLFSLEDIWVSI